MRGLLPLEIITRPDRLRGAAGEMVRGELSGLLRGTLLDDRAARRGLFDRRFLEKMVGGGSIGAGTGVIVCGRFSSSNCGSGSPWTREHREAEHRGELRGRAWSMVLAVVFIPLYLKFLGIEAYGLVGFFAALQSIFGIMDFGIGMTLNREMARLSAVEGKEQERRDLLSDSGVDLLGNRPAGGGRRGGPRAADLALLGQSRQPLRERGRERGPADGAGDGAAVPVLLLPGRADGDAAAGAAERDRRRRRHAARRGGGLDPVAGVALHPGVLRVAGRRGSRGTVACGFHLWRSLPASAARPRFRSALLRDVWRFAAAVSGNAIVGVFLTQIDKVVLSGMLSLEMFGYYALAGTVAASVWSIILPINTALFPRFAELTELRNDASLSELYHRSCQFLAVVLLPISATLAFFSREIMLIWTSNPITAEKTYLVVTLLVIGTTMNGLSSVGSYLLSASGWPQLVLFTNLASAILLVPGIVLMTSRFGTAGAAIIWMMLNSIYLLFTIPFMHRRLLKGEMWRWYREDVGMPLVGVLVFGGITRLLLPDFLSRWATFGYITGAWFLILAVTILLAAHVRSEVSRRVSSLFRVDYA